MTKLKALSFLKAYKKLLRKGGYIRRWENGKNNKKVYLISKQGRFLKGTLLDNGNIADAKDATLNRGGFSESKHWNHYPMPEIKVDTASLPEVLPIPNTVAGLTPIFNSQLNNMCGVGHKKVVAGLEKIISNNGPMSRDLAKIYLMILQSAIYSQLAVQKTGKEKKEIYKEKSNHVIKLVNLCLIKNITVGQELKIDMPNPVIFFDIPGCEQITICSNIQGVLLPSWQGEPWDGKRASTILKIEKAIMSSDFKNYL
mgnify:CR=1 FL=1